MIMKKIFLFLVIFTLLAGCVYATQTVEINNVTFEIPSKYSGGEIDDDEYELDNVFSIRCIDEDVAGKIGLWAVEKDSSEDLNINNHPVRHFSQYNKYVGGNHSHAYFASGKSVYEIAWTDKEINSDIEKLIKSTPQSKIDDESFYNALDESVNIYKREKIDKLNQESEYNYLESKYLSQSNPQNTDDTRFKEILFTYYLNR